MIRLLLPVLGLAGAACAPIPAPAPAADPPTTSPLRPAVGPEIVVRFDPGRQAPRYLVERVAAGCWLDGVVGGAQMIVNRETGGLIIVGETSDLLAAEFLAPQAGMSRVRLSGPAIADPTTKTRLVTTLDRAARTGQATCPTAEG